MSPTAMSSKLEMGMIYDKGSLPTMVTWHNSRMKCKKSYICFHGDVQTSVSLCHSIKVTFDEFLWKYLVWWNVKGCLLKMKKNGFSWVTVGRNIIVPFMWEILGY